MRRRIAILLALVVAWTCYGFVVISLADQEAGRCHHFGDLAAECTAPFALFFGAVSLVFLLATLVLAVLAFRAPIKRDTD